jgi:hypothetical protein
MPGPDFLVVELCRDGAEIKKHTVVDARTYGESRPTAGERAALAAAALVVGAMPLRPGDRLIVRAPVEGEDVPPTYVRSARQRSAPNATASNQTSSHSLLFRQKAVQ